MVIKMFFKRVINFDKQRANLSRKTQYYDKPQDDTIWCYFVKGVSNPCGCGSNCYHYEYNGEKIYGVCNACKTDIYEVKIEYIKEKLKQGVWK